MRSEIRFQPKLIKEVCFTADDSKEQADSIKEVVSSIESIKSFIAIVLVTLSEVTISNLPKKTTSY